MLQAERFRRLELSNNIEIHTGMLLDYNDGEMSFDIFAQGRPTGGTVITNLTLDDAKQLRDRLNEFIDTLEG